MPSRIQALLSEIYDLDLDANVDDFVCDAEVARCAVGDAVERGEVLVVIEEEDDVSVGLYIDAGALATLKDVDAAATSQEGFGAFSLVTEGVSHLLYLLFRAHYESSVSPLELEIQAEVDKYAAGLLAGNGVGAIRERSRALRRRLFEGVEYIDGPDTTEGQRYRAAHRIAARYVARLERDYVDPGRLAELATELRRFYRLSRLDKTARADGF